MAKIKGKGIAKPKKEVAKRKMKVVKRIFILATVFICGLLLIAGVAGLMGKGTVIEQYGGAEAMAKLTGAELQQPYFKYVNELVSALPGPSLIWTLIWLIPMALLVVTCRLHWGIMATAWFTFGLFLEIIFVVVCGILYSQWRKIAMAKPEKRKSNVDLVAEMNQKAQEEAKKQEQEAKEAAKRAKDEDWERRRKEIMLEKTQERVQRKSGGRHRT